MFPQHRLGESAFTALFQNTEDGETKPGQLETILAINKYANGIYGSIHLMSMQKSV